MKEATMVYKHPGPYEVHGNYFDHKVVDAHAEEGETSELDKALADGWFRTTTEALDGTPADREPPTRAELEAKAKELGIKLTKATTDEQLAAQISAKLEG